MNDLIKYIKFKYSYNAETGKLYNTKTGKIRTGFIDSDGYLRIMIKSKIYKYHKIIWAYINDNWPEGELDHINRISIDNRIENLRECTRSENNQNRKTPANNTSGIKGVSFDKSRNSWYVYIQKRFIGRFKNKEEAIKKRIEKEKEIFGEFSTLNTDKNA